MKRHRCMHIESLIFLALLVVGWSLRVNVQLAMVGTGRLQTTKIGASSSSWISSLRQHDVNHRESLGSNTLSMLARAKSLRIEQERLFKEAKTQVLSPKAYRRIKRERRAFFREKYACSGYRLIKMQRDDPDSFYIAVVGANRSGRAQALKAIETFLKQATELKVGPYYKPNTRIKLLESGSLRISEMEGKDENKLGLLRRSNLLVHVVRCFDLQAPPKHPDNEGVATEVIAPSANVVPRKRRERGWLEPWEEKGLTTEEVEWPIQATPLQDAKHTVADMALADLQFIQERRRKTHTRHFWRDRARALNELKALKLVEPTLEDVYAEEGTLEPMGDDFSKSCLKDEQAEDGTIIRKSWMRASITEIGFLSSKPVVYVANLPTETVRSDGEDEDNGAGDGSADAGSIARVALAHAETVMNIERDHGIPAVAACLSSQEGRDSLGAKVFRAIPREVLARDPKVKKAAKSAANKLRHQSSQKRRDKRTPRAESGSGEQAQSQVGHSVVPEEDDERESSMAVTAESPAPSSVAAPTAE